MNRRLHFLAAFLLSALVFARANNPFEGIPKVPNDITITGFITPCTANPPNGAVDLTVTPPDNYTYAWSNGATTEDITDLPAGYYTVTVTLAGVCTGTETFAVPALNPGPLSVTGTATWDTCAMGVGAINLTVWAGNPPFVFNWSNGAQTEDLTGLTGSGSYFVTISDGLGAIQNLDFFVGNYTGFFNQNISNYYSQSSFDNTTCNSPPNGGIAFTPLTSTPFNWAWSNGVTTPSNLDISGGTYSATVTLGNCTQSWNPSITIFDSPNNPLVATAPIDAICGGENGAINLTVTGGAAPFSFSWANADGSFSANTEDIANIPADDYSVTVTGANGCTYSGSTPLSNINLGLNISATVAENSSCTVPNGSISTNTQPNPPPSGVSYAYEWADGQTTPNISGLAAGNYTLTVTLGSTCSADTSFFVGNGTQAPSLNSTTSPETCQGLGSVNLSLSGGTGPFAFLWSNGANTEDLTAVPAGNYTVTVTAADGCSATDSAIVTNSNSGADTTYVSGTTCNSMEAGIFEITFTGSGGCDSVVITTVSLSPSDTTTILGNTCFANEAGVFEQNLTNQFGCDSTVISTITYVGSDTTYLSGSSCDASEVGVFEETLTNGFGCDSIVITTIVFLNVDTTTLFETSCDPSEAGVFEEILTNANGCDSVIITTVSFANADTTNLFSTTCDPNQAGVFETTLTNQHGCDSLVVTTVSLSPMDTNLLNSTTCDPTEAGVFEEIYTNSSGCDSVVITTVSFVNADTTYLFETTCVMGNVGVFVEDWVGQNGCDSTVITTVDFSMSDTTQLHATTCDASQVGVSEQLFTTAEGCDSLVITTLTLAPPVTTDITATTCDPMEVGVFTVTLETWQGCDSIVTTTVTLLPGSSTNLSVTTCDASQTGVFTEILTNWLGCDSTVTTTVTYSPTINTNIDATTCVASEAGIFIETLVSWQGCDSIVTTTVALLPSSSSSVTSTTCDPQAAGVFTETLTNWLGCDSVVTTTVSYVPPPLLSFSTSNYLGYSVSCVNGNDGSIQITANSGTPPLSYNWSNGATTPTVEDLYAGIYSISVTDGNGCISTIDNIDLSEPDYFELNPTIVSPTCDDLLGGEISWVPTGGVPPYLFTMDGDTWHTSTVYAGLEAGQYQVIGSDANGCMTAYIFDLTGPEMLVLELTADEPIIHAGESANLQAIVNVPIGTLTEVTWTGLENRICNDCLEQEVSPTETTLYTLTVEDAYGCSATDSISINVIPSTVKNNIYVPNAFSPNRDGINDNLTVFAEPGRVKLVKSFLIFDNWGDAVYAYYNFPTNDPTVGWDGKHKGELMDPAVFVWYADVAFADGEYKRFSGTVSLVRK
ncbi:MAG: hypothetical protein GC192_00510 [Bacteroidetes bacterium]|nr:hypothetical protein [Bacteroidota bacterium]